MILIILGVFFFVLIFILISLEVINKTILALLGAVLFIALGILNEKMAYEEIDWNVIFLLIGMMVIVGITKRSGLFQYIAIKSAKVVHGDPVKILILFSVITALLSALLDNVTTVLILTPVIILISVELGLNPIPFIISSALASNIGGMATLIGDPPNIMIGSAANLGFTDFLINLGPLALILMVMHSGLVLLFFKKDLKVSMERRARIMDFDENASIKDKTLLIKSLVVLFLVLLFFLLHGVIGLAPSTIALGGAAVLMLLAGSDDVEEFFNEVEWSTIFFFIGLFIMVGGLVNLGVINFLAEKYLVLTHGDMFITSESIIWVSGFLSAFLDNIPYVATMIPLVERLSLDMGTNIDPVWWSLAIGACLGGNGTLIGASANVVSAGLSGRSGYKISFMEFTKYGMVVMVCSLMVSSAYVYFRYLM
ncbi:ArsB/NhaD family transporter [Oceanispirochaeta sp.]|jgi:Na+/H+ antiporter NhaD/arsenite permease-like protein|uniref:ArsB/NhaD family transporter n=1 Tax=Oceanispirochaeta sp. TaxID=2035350 RepID=UPI00260F6341|nr:ArsB/NhaD family transporter [Oceanispirochaeta sp.]MDA3957868.1 ArsB/NhaD family transporter [Oceanispirochaeta sp.]